MYNSGVKCSNKNKCQLIILTNKNVSIVHRCPTCNIIFYVQWTVKLDQNANFALKLERSYHMEHES